MSLDAVLKRFWFLVLGALVALVAYVQGSGIGQLVAARLTPASVPPPAIPKQQALSAPNRGAGPILSRNAFDSVTGPLDGKTVVVADAAPPPVVNNADPYQDQPCPGFKSSLVTAAEDPAWSFASLSSSEGKGQLRRMGDTVAGATVLHIGWFESPDPDVVPRVWLRQASGRCIVEMGAGEPPRPTPKAPVTAPPKKGDSKRAALTAEIEAMIKKTGENSYEVERAAVEQIIQNYAKLAGSLRTRATNDGMRLSGIKPDNILSKLGMKNGDMLTSINGFDMSDPDKAVDAYAKLRSAGKLGITVTRDGSPFTIDISIKR